jgi:WD40 repeat protein
VAYHVNTNEQWCFVGHADKVSSLALSIDNKLLASGQSGPFSIVRVWDFDSRKCLAIFRNHDHSLYLLEFSSCGNFLCGVGKDKQGKTMLVLWDIKEICAANHKPSGSIVLTNSVRLVAKAHTDVHINKVLFLPYDSTRLITCGKDNVRFWRLKDDTLRSHSVNLSSYTQALNSVSSANKDIGNVNNGVLAKTYLEFTDLSMNSRLNSNNENLVYACTRTGQIFEFNTYRMEIENVRVLEPVMAKKSGILSNKQSEVPLALRLNSLTVTNSFCATGSDDGFVRVWPLDFSQVSVEAEHESPIGIVKFSPDCLRIATATLNGQLGVLDVKKKEYLTLVRSHSDSILDAAINRECCLIATCSLDSTVRVWNFETGRQLYDFEAEDESPTRVCFHSQLSNVFACGFNSGKIRVFNVDQTKLISEIPVAHTTTSNSKLNEITDLKYSTDAKRLICGDLMKYLCLYDADRDYALIRMLPNCISASGSLCISPDHKHLAVIGSADYLISVYEASNLNEVLRIDITPNAINKQAELAVKLSYASHNLNQLICATSGNKILKFDAKTGRILSSIVRIHKTNIDCLISSDDGRFLITSGDNAIKVWDYEMRMEQNFQTFIGHSSNVNCLLLSSPDNSILISIGDSIVFWDFLAFKSSNDHSNERNVMPNGRKLEEMKDLQTNHVSIVRESKSKNKLKHVNDVNKLLYKNSFEEMKINSQTKKPISSLTSKSMSALETTLSSSSSANENRLLASSTSVIDWITSGANISFEKPRTPPIATEIHIETVAVNGEIEDTFLNDEFTLLDSNLSGNSSVKKFINLPTFVNGDTIFEQYLSPCEQHENYDKDEDLKRIGNKQPYVQKHLNIRKKSSIAASR